MTYSFSCFISYKRPPKIVTPPGILRGPPVKHLWMQFAEAFEATLSEYLNTNIPVFRDEYLSPGSDYPIELSQNLCRSVCMVALVVPEYFESSWCLAEWNAMQTFETDRLGGSKPGLLIPVLCVGDPATLDPFLGPREGIDLRDVVSPAQQLKTLRNRRKIKIIADIINQHARTLQPPKIDCGMFSLAVGPETITPKINEPSPFG